MKIKKLLMLLLITLTTLFAQNKTHEKITLQLQWKHQFEFAGFYIAKEKGFYKDFGLDVKIKEFNNDINVVKDVVSQKATFGTYYPSLILEKSKGKDIVLLSAILQSSPHALISLESSGIKSLKDFKNKTLMIDTGVTKVAPFVSMLQSNHISFDEINRVPHSFNIEDLINKKVDISTIFTTNEPYYLDQKNIKYKIWDPKEYGFDFSDVILFTSSDIIKNHPKMATNFRNASLKGWEYAFSNIDETIDLILKKYNSQNKTRDALKYEALKLKKLAYYKNKKLGSIDTNTIQRIFDVYNILGLTQEKINYDSFIYKSSDDIKALNLTREELAFIKKHPVITVGGEKDWPPFDYVENGQYTGIAKEYLDLIEKYTGLVFDVKIGYTWSELLNLIKKKQIDLLPMIYYEKDREKFLNYTNEYLRVRNYLFTSHENKEKYESLDDLKNKTIAIPEGFIQIKILKKLYPKIKILETKSVLESIDSIITNKADAMIANIALVNHLLKTNHIQGIKSNFSTNIGINSLYMSSRKDWPILRDIIQKGLDSISYEEKNMINNKWIDFQKNTNKSNLTLKEKSYLENNEFNVYLNNWLPISIYDEKNNEFSGLSLDYWNEIKKIIPIQDNLFYSKSFLNSIDSLKKDKNAIMISLSYTEDRAKYGSFSKPYASYPIGIATKDNKNFILDLTELEGKKIAVGKNFSAHKLLKKHYPKIKFVPVKNTLEALDLLAKGEVYGAADILFTLKFYLQEYAYKTLKIAGTSDFKFDLRIMVNKESSNLIPIINKAIDNLSDDQKKLFQNKWIQIIKHVDKTNYTIIYIMLSVFILIVLFLLWRHKELSKYKNALEEKTNQLYDYIEASTDFVWELDKNMTYTKVNGKVEDILGYKPEEIIGKSPFDFMSKDEASKISKILSNKETIQSLQNKNIHKDGSLILLLTNAVPIFKNGEFIGYRGTNKDITKEKKQDLIILEQSKMAAMGEMMANISHQWRQPLSVISTAASGMLMQKELDFLTDKDLEKYCNTINEQAQHLSKTIDTFRNFISEKKVLKAHPIEEEISSAISIVKASLENRYIKLEDNIDYTKTNIINSVVNELSEVLINIINNSKDIISERKIPNSWIKIDLIKESDKIIITIEDNGKGIPHNVLPRIFEPYYTTKHKAKGTGLGLHMSYKIITQSLKGNIYAENTSNGAKFYIEIPNN